MMFRDKMNCRARGWRGTFFLRRQRSTWLLSVPVNNKNRNLWGRRRRTGVFVAKPLARWKRFSAETAQLMPVGGTSERLRADYFYCLFIPEARSGSENTNRPPEHILLSHNNHEKLLNDICRPPETTPPRLSTFFALIVAYRPFHCRGDNWSVCLSRRA